MPTIDNLLALSDIYDCSLDTLVQGSTFFKKPYVVGKKYTMKKGLLFSLLWLFFSLFLTGFGYQPTWVFVIVFVFGFIFILPITFKDYWIIEKEGIKVSQYAENYLKKLKQLISPQYTPKYISYTDIQSIAIIYKKKVRLSLLDFHADPFFSRNKKI